MLRITQKNDFFDEMQNIVGDISRFINCLVIELTEQTETDSVYQPRQRLAPHSLLLRTSPQHQADTD
jgi:hypothetical protein